MKYFICISYFSESLVCDWSNSIILGFRTTCSPNRKKKNCFPPKLWTRQGSIKTNSALKRSAGLLCNTLCDTLLILNGGPALLDETADELWFTEALWREQRLIFLSAMFGLHQKSLRVIEETANEVHLLYSAINFRGESVRAFGARQKPSEHNYQLASGHTVIYRVLIIWVC